MAVSRLIELYGLKLFVTASGGKILGLEFAPTEEPASCGCHEASPVDIAILDEAERQLREYFEGRRRAFDLPLELSGTPFQRLVWDALLGIPYGEVKTYGELARKIGKPRAARAVGGACHANPIAIIVPCHRVVGTGGALVGFGGGLDVKEKLLDLERANK